MFPQINKTYNFTTIAPGILGSTFTNMKVVSILNASEAIKYRDIITIHNQIRSEVPNVQLPINYTDCTFIKFSTESGGEEILAYEYIDSNSLQEVSSKTLVITVNNYTLNDYTLIQNALRDLGFFDFKAELK